MEIITQNWQDYGVADLINMQMMFGSFMARAGCTANVIPLCLPRACNAILGI